MQQTYLTIPKPKETIITKILANVLLRHDTSSDNSARLFHDSPLTFIS